MPLIRRRRPLRRPLKPHQIEGYKYASGVDHAAFFMEMRLGKTLLCIRWLIRKPYVRKALVIAPVIVLEAWEKELAEEGIKYATCYGLSPEQRDEVIQRVWDSPERMFLLLSYETILAMGDVFEVRGRRRRDTPLIAWLPWDAAVLDESTKIKNVRAQISAVCAEGFRHVRHRAILSGLPNPENDLELFSQFKFLDGQFMGHTSFWTWQLEYFTQYDKYNWTHKPGSRTLIKQHVHARAFVKTALEAGMKAQIHYEVRPVEMTVKQRKLYRQIERDYAASLEDGSHVETSWALTQRIWLHKLAGGFDPENNLVCGRLADTLIEILLKELGNKKAVVWFRFRHELEYVRSRLAKAGISAVSIMGGEPQAERKRKLEIFRGKTRVLLAMEKCAKFGIDCSVSDTAIYYSNEPSNEDRTQSVRRIVSYVRQIPRLVIDLVFKDTIGEDMVSLVRDKSLNSTLFMKRYDAAIKARFAGKKTRSKQPTPEPLPETRPAPKIRRLKRKVTA